MLHILKSMFNWTYFSYTVLTLIFGKLCMRSLKYMSISTVFHEISESPIGIQCMKKGQSSESMANIININGELVFKDYINAFLRNISCVNLLFNVIITCLLCIALCFLTICECLKVHCMLKTRLCVNKMYFIHYYIMK